MEHQHSHRYRKSKNMAGKLITILQLILSAALLILVWNSGMVPNLYLALMGAGTVPALCHYIFPAVHPERSQIPGHRHQPSDQHRAGDRDLRVPACSENHGRGGRSYLQDRTT